MRFPPRSDTDTLHLVPAHRMLKITLIFIKHTGRPHSVTVISTLEQRRRRIPRLKTLFTTSLAFLSLTQLWVRKNAWWAYSPNQTWTISNSRKRKLAPPTLKRWSMRCGNFSVNKKNIWDSRQETLLHITGISMRSITKLPSFQADMRKITLVLPTIGEAVRPSKNSSTGLRKSLAVNVFASRNSRCTKDRSKSGKSWMMRRTIVIRLRQCRLQYRLHFPRNLRSIETTLKSGSSAKSIMRTRDCGVTSQRPPTLPTSTPTSFKSTARRDVSTSLRDLIHPSSSSDSHFLDAQQEAS